MLLFFRPVFDFSRLSFVLSVHSSLLIWYPPIFSLPLPEAAGFFFSDFFSHSLKKKQERFGAIAFYGQPPPIVKSLERRY